MAAADPQDEILAAACLALDKAHSLLSFVVRYEGQCTPQFVEACKKWVEGEYDPGTHRPRVCDHVPMKAVTDNSVSCIRCGLFLGSAA